MSVICLNCEGWGCASCHNDREAAKTGEQGLHPLEVEIAGLRKDVTRLTAQRDAAETLVGEQRELLLQLKDERDRLLTELAMRVPGGKA